MTSALERREERVALLRAAAARKSAAANQRADAGIRRLLRSGEPISFRGIARAGGVSIDFLYRNQELRQRIEQLRGQRAHARRAATPDAAPGESSVVAVLRARLQERAGKRAGAAGSHPRPGAAARGRARRDPHTSPLPDLLIVRRADQQARTTGSQPHLPRAPGQVVSVRHRADHDR
jgi:Family of unknown function (DUF6262)